MATERIVVEYNYVIIISMHWLQDDEDFASCNTSLCSEDGEVSNIVKKQIYIVYCIHLLC